MAFLVRDYVVVWVVLVVASILGAGRLGVRGEGGRGGGETNFKLSRSSFPKGFVFGIASSAYQFEGAAKEGGKGLSIWDVYAHKHPEKIKDGSNADITVDEYHRYKEDVSIMKDIGFDAYRLSISWTRILPKGNLRGGLNQEGIQYYNDLINELLSKGIQPYVTIFHWDSPQGLEDEYLGFLSSKIVKDFRDYADICFKKFGDRVKHWITFNEPHSFCVGGYAKGTKAPGRCSAWEKGNCSVGDSATEPYVAAHNMLIAHAAAVKLYRKNYQKHQKGIIGIILDSPWMVPSSSSKADEEAAHRAFDYTLGWYMEPLANGQYPQSMVSKVGDRLPKFTERESQMLKRSFDFIGINYYSGFYATAIPPSEKIRSSYETDMLANITLWSSDGKPIGAVAGSSWLTYYPQGIHDFMVYMKKKYNNPPIYITENGWNTPKNDSLSIEEELKDDVRIKYYKDHLEMLHKAIHSDGVDVRGFFGWSLLDNYEWAEGFTVRFGICYVDFKNGLKRYLKQSAHWFQKFLKG